MIKNFKTADGIKVKVTTLIENSSDYFKYEIVNTVNSSTDISVSFKILNSPRNTNPEEGVGYVKLEMNDKIYFIGASCQPEIYEDQNILFVRGSDSAGDNNIITCSSELFNIFQLGMLVWNICVSEHRTKQIYTICNICGDYSSEKMHLSEISTKFKLNTYSCCPLPSNIYIEVSKDDALFSENKHHNKCTLKIPSWWSGKNILPNVSVELREHVFNVFNSFSENVFVANVCTCCFKPVSQDKRWLCHEEVPSLCKDCSDSLKLCAGCGISGINFEQWGTTNEYYCPRCASTDTCYVCHIDLVSRDSYGMTRYLSIGGQGHNLCFNHYQQIQEQGWRVTKLSPERSYSWKKTSSELQVMEFPGKLSPAIEKVSVIPVAALEWEFPFNKATTKTNTRDRAIWMFEEIQREAGYEGLFIAKHDGSLPSFATEFVSNHPKTLKMWHKLFFDGVLNKLVNLMDTKYVNDNPSSVGGHIHINRGSFTPTQIAKAMKFLYSNTDFLSFICDRPQTKDNNYYKHVTGINPLTFAYNSKASSPEKYTIARVTSKIDNHVEMGTVEVRAFKSPTSAVQVIQNVEFMFALRSYVKDISGKDIIKANTFIDYVQEQNTQFPLLAERLITRNKKIYTLNTPNVGKKESSSQATTRRTSCSDCDCTINYTPLYMSGEYPHCNECAFVCAECDNIYHSCDHFSLNDRSYCPSCFNRLGNYCDYCETAFLRTDLGQTQTAQDVCHTCIEELFFICEGCGSIVRNGSICECAEEML